MVEIAFLRVRFIILVIISILALNLVVTDAGEFPGDPPQNTFQIVVDLPSKAIQDVRVMGLLPSGLIYEGDILSIAGAASSASQTVDGPNDGNAETAVTWSFGDVDNLEDRDIEISFRAVVADVAGNQGNDVLPPIKASASWRDPGGASYSSSDESGQFMVVEPDLALKREGDQALVEAGESATFTISFYHTSQSGSDAFDVDFEEILPEGINYVPDTIEILLGPKGILDDSDPSRLRWHFDAVDTSWSKARSVVLRYKAVVRDGQSNPEEQTRQARQAEQARQKVEEPDSVSGRALLTWSSASGENPEEREYSASLQSSLDLQPNHGLTVSQEDRPDPVSPGGVLNYTITYESLGQDSHGVVVQETYDDRVVFLSATPQPDEGTYDRWTLGDLLEGVAGSIELVVRVKPSLKTGTTIQSTVEVHSGDGLNASESCVTKVRGPAYLSIENRPSSNLISPGGSLNYTLTFRNNGDIEASNVTVIDIIDSCLEFDADRDVTPQPTSVQRDHEGIHLWWSAEALGSESLKPGESRMIEIQVRLPLKPEHPSIDRISNSYKIDSDQYAGEFRSLETFVVQSLFVRKMADKNDCSAGDILNYTILYGNKLDAPASNAVITDTLPDVDFIDASPEPSYVEDNLLVWRIGTIPPKMGGSITLLVRVRELPEINFRDSQSIFGQGRVSARQWLSTAHQPSSLANCVNITASYPTGKGQDSSCSMVKRSDALGVEMESVQHGLGDFEEVRLINYSEKGMSIDRRLSAVADRTGTRLAQWADRIVAKNEIRAESITLSHLYTDGIIKEDSLLLDQNQTVYSSLGDYSSGIARLRYAKHPSVGSDSSLDISEDYHGSFRSGVRLDSYGRGVEYDRHAAGTGFISSDMKYSDSKATQRSYEHGSGSYRLDELLTPGPAVYKNVEMNRNISNQSAGSFHVSYTSKWGEGMSSEDREFCTRLGATVSHADYIQKEALMGSASLAMTSEFSGTGSIKASTGKEDMEGTNKSEISKMNDMSGKADGKQLDETFIGRFNLDVTLGMSRMPKYLSPHLNLTKRAVRSQGDKVLFRINITNDGNKTLAPLEIIDRLPYGLVFINSSERPKVDGQNVRWRLLSLSIGETRTIDLQAQWNESIPAILNEAEAVGYSGHQTVTARAFCAFPGCYRCNQGDSKAGVTGNAEEIQELQEIQGLQRFQGGPWEPSPCMDVGANLSGCLSEESYTDCDEGSFSCSCSSW